MKTKPRLFTPGPTNIPLHLFKAMEEPSLHHRTAKFETHFRAALDGLKWLLKTKIDPILLAGSGTAAMEAALLNVCAPGDKILYINAGKFGERWGDIGNKLGLNCQELTVTWGSSPSRETLETFIAAHPDARALCVQYVETSTTVQHPVRMFSEVLRKVIPSALLIADAVSALGTMPIFPDEDDIDILAAASHKGLMLPPGLALLHLSEKAWQKVEASPARTHYFDLREEKKAHAKNTTAWTPAVHLVLGLTASLAALKEEGFDAVCARHNKIAAAVRAAFAALGLQLLTTDFPAAAVTGCFIPASANADKVRSYASETLGAQFADGQGDWKGKIIRYGHMGDIDILDALAGISALELSLQHAGYSFTPGTGVGAAMKVFAHVA